MNGRREKTKRLGAEGALHVGASPHAGSRGRCQGRGFCGEVTHPPGAALAGVSSFLPFSAGRRVCLMRSGHVPGWGSSLLQGCILLNTPS